jgi:hypothetical protein
MMSPQQLEAKVLSIVMAIRAGMPIEDDVVECKREWPDPGRWRQLAGSANCAAGEPILWIIGIDERTGATVPLGDTDPAPWWAQLSKGFDEGAPELIRHIVVHVGSGEAVVALMFSTDRPPYVVRCQGGGSPEREVPFRDGTRTRSVYRHELLRMLVPNAATPPTTLLEANLAADFNQARQLQQRPTDAEVEVPASLGISGNVVAFNEPSMGDYAFLPEHGMRCWLRPDDSVETIECEVELYMQFKHQEAKPLGITNRGDGILAQGPGRFGVSINARLDPEAKESVRAVHEWSLTIEFDVAGRQRPIRLIAQLHQAPTQSSEAALAWQVKVGSWSTTSQRPNPIDWAQPFPN